MRHINSGDIRKTINQIQFFFHPVMLSEINETTGEWIGFDYSYPMEFRFETLDHYKIFFFFQFFAMLLRQSDNQRNLILKFPGTDTQCHDIDPEH